MTSTPEWWLSSEKNHKNVVYLSSVECYKTAFGLNSLTFHDYFEYCNNTCACFEASVRAKPFIDYPKDSVYI